MEMVFKALAPDKIPRDSVGKAPSSNSALFRLSLHHVEGIYSIADLQTVPADRRPPSPAFADYSSVQNRCQEPQEVSAGY